MQKHFEVLKKCPLFYGIDEHDISGMLACLGAKILSFSKGETVISEGDDAKYVGIVLSGSVQLIKIDYYGNRSIVASMTSSELFGESFACAENKKMPADVIANKDCEIMLLNCAKIIRSCSNACEFHNLMIFNLLKVVTEKNIQLTQKSEIISKRSTREKLMCYLLLQAKKHKNGEFKIPFDRQELADYLEVDRSGLSAAIGKLKKEGVLESKKNYFKLL